ncbi:MAG: hypothetical protein WBF90_22540 [Rivularia sp. (in: cyanobacteria)]
MGFDLVGGVITNATSSAKRWFHRTGQTWQHHLAFVSIHIFHIFLVALLFRDSDWSFLAIAESYLIGASILMRANSSVSTKTCSIWTLRISTFGQQLFVCTYSWFGMVSTFVFPENFD